jgi:AraC-like DNA-binding protein
VDNCFNDELAFSIDACDHPAFGPSSEAPALLGVEIKCRGFQAAPRGDGAAAPRPPGWASYIGPGFGLFISNPAAAPTLNCEIETTRPVLVFRVITGATRERQHRLDSRISTPGSSIEIAYLPRNTTFKGLIDEDGFRSVALLLDPDVLTQNLGLSLPDLPHAIQGLSGSTTTAVATYPISSAVQRVAEEALDHVPEAGRLGGLFYRLKALQLFWEIVERFGTEDRIVTRAVGPNEKELCSVERVRTLLEKSPAEEYPIERLARLAAMNRTKLRSIFKDIYGQTISQFRTEVRMRRAHELLHETKLSVAEIGFDLGYADASSFIVAFKKFFGFNPGRMRSSSRTAVSASYVRDNECAAIAECA